MIGEREKPSDPKGIVKEEDIRFLSGSTDACRPGNPRDAWVEEIAELYRSLIEKATDGALQKQLQRPAFLEGSGNRRITF